MPVIAKLSRRFYEVLGEDVADQMVEWFNQVGEAYRADWRHFHDAGFSRSDAKLDRRSGATGSQATGFRERSRSGGTISAALDRCFQCLLLTFLYLPDRFS